MGKIFATKKEEISQSWFDVFSFGHFLKGFLTFIAVYVFLGSIELKIDYYSYSLIAVILGSLLFEIIENNFLAKLKYTGIRDSFQNSQMDVIFDTIGGLFAWFVLCNWCF